MQESPDLYTKVDSKNLVQRYLTKQADLDKILKIIQRKLLKKTHLLGTAKEVQTGYFNSPYFQNVYCI